MNIFLQETLCSFALSGAMAKTPGLAASGAKPLFTLPDGTAIDLTAECFAVPELLMSGRSDDAEAAAEGEGGGRAMELEAAPEGEALPVLPQMLYDSVKECHADLRKDLLKHVLLSGAGTLMPGYKKRLAKEMASLGTYDINTKIESYHIFIFSSCFLLYYSYVMTE